MNPTQIRSMTTFDEALNSFYAQIQEIGPSAMIDLLADELNQKRIHQND